MGKSANDKQNTVEQRPVRRHWRILAQTGNMPAAALATEVDQDLDVEDLVSDDEYAEDQAEADEFSSTDEDE